MVSPSILPKFAPQIRTQIFMNTQTRTIAFHTLGCKLNFSETATISRDFSERGFRIVPVYERADIYVINTCSVTDNADNECRKIVRQVKRRNPESIVALVGCFAQLKPDELGETAGVDIVLGTGEKFRLLEAVESYNIQKSTVVLHSNTADLDTFSPSHSANERTRVFLKIQDGCDYPCTYCTIPAARGKSRNDSIKNTMNQARKIASTDAREIVLTGVNIGDFGVSTGETFLDLIQELDTLDGIDRIRISSIEPNLLTDEILDFVNQSNLFVPHFHMPLQSGSNKILSDMKRRYKKEVYADRVASIKKRFPGACIGADVIVGFPTETQSWFEESYLFITDLDIEYLHVFSYSERPGTAAASMASVVSVEEKKERSKRLRILSEKKRSFFHEKNILNTTSVLFETFQDGLLSGHTPNYIQVQSAGDPSRINQIVPVRLEKNHGRHMVGTLLVTS